MMRQPQNYPVIEETQFATNGLFQSDTITRLGIPPTLRLDYLVFDFRVRLTIAPAAQLYIGTTGVDFLNALVGSIQWQSGPLGEIIQQQGLGDLFMTALPLGARIHGDLPSVNWQFAAALATVDLNFQVVIPWKTAHRKIGSYFAPQNHQFPDGRLICRFGAAGTYTDGFGQVWTINNANSQVRVEWRGDDPMIKYKASPIQYLTSLYAQRQQQLQGGLQLAIVNQTDTVNGLTAFPVSGGGLVLKADGVHIFDNTEFDPKFVLTAAKDAIRPNGYSWFGVDTAPGDLLDTTPFVPIVFYERGVQLDSLISSEDQLFLQLGGAWNANFTLTQARVRPVDEINDSPGCKCPTGGPSMLAAEGAPPRIDQYLPKPIT